MTFASNMSWTTFTAQPVCVCALASNQESQQCGTNTAQQSRLRCCCLAGPPVTRGLPAHSCCTTHPAAGFVLNDSKLISLIPPIRESRSLTSFHLLGTLTCCRWLADSKGESRPLVTTAPPPFPTAFVSYVTSMAVSALWEKQQLWFPLSAQLLFSLPAMKMSCEGKSHSAVLQPLTLMTQKPNSFWCINSSQWKEFKSRSLCDQIRLTSFVSDWLKSRVTKTATEIDSTTVATSASVSLSP